jgi:myxalamid-type polyketide synthase MxaB
VAPAGTASSVITVAGRELINYASYNYLGLADSPEVAEAAIAAIQQYGTSVCASRILSGEIPLHQELEAEIADFLQTEACIVYVGGHTTNTTTIGHLFGKNDLILYDGYAHNSIRQGCALSNADALEFPHNDYESLAKLLKQHRRNYQQVLIAIEGIYSADGDIAPLPEIIALKKEYKTYLLVDEAHSLGVLGKTGRGIGEYFNVPSQDVDLWMGTLSKSLASCGGYIAGSRSLIEYLKYTAPGFIFSVGISPANAAASLKAIRMLRSQPQPVQLLRDRVQLFLCLAHNQGFKVNLDNHSGIIPIIVGESNRALELSNRLFDIGINVLPMIFPSVPYNGARLRFFITSNHTEEQIRWTITQLFNHYD